MVWMNSACFSVLHEIGNYVLPHHEHALYVCDDVGLSFATRLVMEKEANEFAANLLFLGDRFSVEANCRQIDAKTVKGGVINTGRHSRRLPGDSWRIISDRA